MEIRQQSSSEVGLHFFNDSKQLMVSEKYKNDISIQFGIVRTTTSRAKFEADKVCF